jgi:multimeric flavodoxin WrbA
MSEIGKVIAISGSMRRRSNTDYFLKIVLDECAKEGFDTELIPLRNKRIEGCAYDLCAVDKDAEGFSYAACGYQHPPYWKPKYDKCILKDDFWPIFEKMKQADGIILGSPVYFGSATPKIKALIDRAGICAEARGHYIRYLKDPKQRQIAENVIKTASPEMQKWYEHGLFWRKVGAAVVVTRRTSANFTWAQLMMFFGICNMIVPGSIYWPISIGGALGYRAEAGEYADPEGEETLQILGRNIAWLIKKIKGIPTKE